MKTIEQLHREIEKRPLRDIKDYIEKDMILVDRRIDFVVLADGTKIPGEHLDHAFDSIFSAKDPDTGKWIHAPYAAIVKVESSARN